MNGLSRAISALSNEKPIMDVRITRTGWKEDEAALRGIRQAVFVEEQRVPESLEWDGEDEASIHFLALDDQQQAIGCIRLMPNGQLSRLSVLEPYRSQGIGKALLERAEQEARQLGMKEITLHAQTHATSFYEAAGFTVTGGTFIEADIPHRQMTKELD